MQVEITINHEQTLHLGDACVATLKVESCGDYVNIIKDFDFEDEDRRSNSDSVFMRIELLPDLIRALQAIQLLN